MKKISFINRCQGIGASYGFATAQDNIQKALLMAGYELTNDAPINIAHISAHMFHREEGKFNVLWFPYEGWELPDTIVQQLNENADLVIASCEDNKETFINSGVTVPIEVCTLGVDTDLFTPDDNKRHTPFRFMWLGQADIRKGWDVLAPSFIKAFTEDEDVQLYLKTTNAKDQKITTINDGKISIDTRNLAVADLIDLYQSANCFLFPTRGEGTGLPALEAMATECLTLAPPIMGLSSFINNETAIPLNYDLINVHYGKSMKAPNVTIDILTPAMRDAYDNYTKYKQIRKQGRGFIIQHNSISSMAVRLNEILEGIII